MKMSFSGKHVLVTGGGSGIGRATCLELAMRGSRIAVVDVDPLAAEATASAVRANGGDAQAYVVDVSCQRDVDALARDAGPVDVLVNNAGVAVVAPFAETALTDWEWALGVNLWGPLRVTRAFLPQMVARGSGHVVVVASLAGLVGAPGMVAYSTSKFAVVGFAESLRHELAGAGVGLTVVCPGYVRTNLHRATRYSDDRFRRFLDAPPSWYGMTGEAVAKKLADAVARRRAMVVLGPERAGWWLKRLAPDLAFTVTRWVARRTVHADGGR
jgi:NAD(P)-dependent dehydrogenase (short-subunit alcohol dehydrogenase family)